MARILKSKFFHFQAQHQLAYPIEARHGHDYEIEVTFENENFRDIESIWRNFLEPHLHGRFLNETVEVPTGENLTRWIFDQLQLQMGPHLKRVQMRETLKNHFACEVQLG
ncbi:MAG: 6-pyruvoyl tetrahydropterin synthase family protein [Bdellovibrionales bacterium]